MAINGWDLNSTPGWRPDTGPADPKARREAELAKKRAEADDRETLYNESWKRMQDAMPGRPEYQSGLGNDGLISSPALRMNPRELEKMAIEAGGDVGMTSNLADLDSRLSGINLNKEGLEAIRQQALSTGPSAWALKANERQGLEEANARDANVKLNATAGNEAMSNLMMQGGWGGGAAERMARDTSRATTSGAQNVMRQGALDRAGIGMTDESNRLDLLKQLPGMEIAALQPELQKTSMWGNMADSEQGRRVNLDLSNRDYKTGVDQFNLSTDMDRQKYNNDANMRSQEFNIGNSLAEKRAKEAADLAAYQEQMKAWGANRTAVAQENSGK